MMKVMGQEQTFDFQTSAIAPETLIEALPVVAFAANPEGQVTKVNRYWLEFTGLEQDKSLGLDGAEAIHPDDRQRVLEIWASSVSSLEPFDFDFRLRRKDGEYRWFLARAQALLTPNGRCSGWIGVFSEIPHNRNLGGANLTPDEVLTGGGEMGALMRSLDWSTTPLGPVERWPQSLRTVLSILLTSRHPIFMWWGPELVQFYNDAYRPILGSTKHPSAMGGQGRETWSEIWHVIEPMIEAVFRGESTLVQDGLLFLDRHGFLEEAYFDYAYSPIRNESGAVGGIFCVVGETTGKIIGERRLRTLRDMASSTLESDTTTEVCLNAVQVLSSNASDIPFALVYLLEQGSLGLRAWTGLEPGSVFAPEQVGLNATQDVWSLLNAVQTTKNRVVEIPNGLVLNHSLWEESPRQALVMPIARQNQEKPFGVLVVGISPRLKLEREYHSFLELVTLQLASAVGDAHAHEIERQRNVQLTELDRAKTTFFSNVSHELRTPITLMLGPLEDVLRNPETLSKVQLEHLRTAQRNAERMLKMVNTLLEFSKLEAGRSQALFEPTDLADLTANLVSSFRSAFERANIVLEFSAETLPKPVYVDSQMWERIVLNLLSNALKFTFEGRVSVRLKALENVAMLEVSDSGIGIPEAEIPRLFERFHRVKGVAGRSLEGTGIGLALVQELTEVLGGTVWVTSTLGVGSRFQISIPYGFEHLPSHQVRQTVPNGNARSHSSADSFLKESLRWLPQEPQNLEPSSASNTPDEKRSTRVLIVDDNPDMLGYLSNLLQGQYQIQSANNGLTALEMARLEPPDLVLTDVMMPGIDGFGLLWELRQHPSTREIPIVMLSARAGDEARAGGLEAGADDYLVKPFNKRELLASIGGNIALARLRRQTTDREHQLRLEAERLTGEQKRFVSDAAHELRAPLTSILGNLELLTRFPDMPGDERGTTLSEAIAESRRLARLVQDMLSLSRGEEPNQTDEVVRLETELESAWKIAQTLSQQRQFELGPLEPATVKGNRDALKQVALILLENAVKYTSDGNTVRLSLNASTGIAEFRVSDTGRGIAPEDQARIFERFFRADRARNRGNDQGGSGLGLSIAKQIIENHGGTIRLESSIGVGTTVIVGLPSITAND
jgi:PAS domain S-box-containing protein